MDIHPEDAQSYYKDIWSTVFIGALFVIVRTKQKPKCPLTKQWIKKVRHIYIIEYYAMEKFNDILKFAGKWVDLEIITLSEVTETQKDK